MLKSLGTKLWNGLLCACASHSAAATATTSEPPSAGSESAHHLTLPSAVSDAQRCALSALACAALAFIQDGSAHTQAYRQEQEWRTFLKEWESRECVVSIAGETVGVFVTDS